MKKETKEKKFWTCVIGPACTDTLQKMNGADAPMRRSVQRAFFELTGKLEDICMSGWKDSKESLDRKTLKQQLVYAVKKTCSPKPKKVILTRGELLKLMVNLAKDYSVFSEDSLKRNGYSDKKFSRNDANDVVCDFLNFVAGQYNLDYGLKPWHLNEEKEDAVEI